MIGSIGILRLAYEHCPIETHQELEELPRFLCSAREIPALRMPLVGVHEDYRATVKAV